MGLPVAVCSAGGESRSLGFKILLHEVIVKSNRQRASNGDPYANPARKFLIRNS